MKKLVVNDISISGQIYYDTWLFLTLELIEYGLEYFSMLLFLCLCLLYYLFWNRFLIVGLVRGIWGYCACSICSGNFWPLCSFI